MTLIFICSDLATIVESLALCDTKPQARRHHSCTEDNRPNTSDQQQQKVNTSSSNSSSSLNKNPFANRAAKISNSGVAAAAQSFVEAVEALDKMREGSDIIRNSTNSFLSSELQNEAINMLPSPPGVRISIASNQQQQQQQLQETDDDKPKRKVTTGGALEVVQIKDGCSNKNESNNARNTNTNCPIVVTNPMSVSVPNLTSTEANSQMEPTTTAGLLETFAALARRRTLGTLGSVSTTNSSNANNAGNALNAGNQNNQNVSCLFPRGPNSVSSLVRLALSSNFHGGLLSTAQSYPSLSTGTNPSGQPCGGIPPNVGNTQGLSQALTMSLTSTSSDSEQVGIFHPPHHFW